MRPYAALLACLGCISCDASVALENTAGNASRRFEVSDAVRVVKAQDVLEGKPIAHYSPDRTMLAVVLCHGNLETNRNDYSVLLWNARTLFSSPEHQEILNMSSSSNRPAIEDITWLNDDTIAFLGEAPGELHQVYELNVRNRKLTKVTRSPTSVGAYAFSTDRRAVVFTAQEPTEPLFDIKETRRGHFASATDQLWELTRQQKDGPALSDKLYWQNIDAPDSAKILNLLQGGVPPAESTPFISPDGHYALVKVFVKNPATSWTAYADPTLQKFFRGKFSTGDSYLQSYELIDAKTGKSRLLLNSPVQPNHDSEAVWLPDSRSVIVSNIFLPLEGVDDREKESRKASALTVEVGISDGKLVKVAKEDVRLLGWDSATGCVAVNNHTGFEFGSLNSARKVDGATRCFRRSTAGWEENSALAKNLSAAEILWKEDLNLPPKLYAVDPRDGHSVLLLDPNPQFDDLTFGKVEEVRWKASDGHEMRGGIVYPVGYLPGRRYPLVIQTHGWFPNKFLVDGLWTTAFAAQALANNGIMVLQADERTETFLVAGEGDAEQANYQGAIDYLDGREMIDRERVGLIGFSRTCYHVKYMLTHSKYAIAAASVTDGFDMGYFQYMAFYALPVVSTTSEIINGGKPFGDGLKSWSEKAVGFRMDQVRAPLLITAMNPWSIVEEWEWYAGLSLLRRPVEFLVLQDGTHVLEKPWDRLASQQGNVDWFRFWLQDYEDPDPAKVEQYTRWRKLREIQDANEAGRAPIAH
jgi:dipeptidyl aminopeptidase/acylaminoacyl peptidase